MLVLYTAIGALVHGYWRGNWQTEEVKPENSCNGALGS